MQYLWLTLLMLALMVSNVLGATATVTGVNNPPTTFATIRDAVEYLKTNYANQANAVDVTTDGPITETAIWDISTNCEGGFTINGDADGNGTPCTVITDTTTQSNFETPAVYTIGTGYTQLFVGGATGVTYTIQDLTFQPLFIAENTIANTVCAFILYDLHSAGKAGHTINMDNVTVAGSKAGNLLAADPNVNEWLLCTRYTSNKSGDSDMMEGPTKNDWHFTNVQVFNNNDEGWDIDAPYTWIDINEGCISAWCGESAITYYSGTDSRLTIDGTPENRILVRGCGQFDTDEEGLNVVGPNEDTTPFNWETLTYTDLIENGAENEMGRHAGPILIDNCFVSLNGFGNDDADGSDTGLRYGYGLLPDVYGSNLTRTIQNCTFYDTLNPAGIQYGLNFQGMPDSLTFNLSNVIIAGTGDDGFQFRDGGDSVMNLSDSALVTVGPNALNSIYVGTADGPGTGNWTFNQTNVTNADPMFRSTVYMYGDTENFLRVTNQAYKTAGPGGGELTGAGASIPPPPASSRNWALYE